MEFKNENEFEQNQTNSVENTENKQREEIAINNSDYSEPEEHVNAVDATFTAGSNEPEEPLESVKKTESEEFVTPPVTEQTRSNSQAEPKKRKGKGIVSTIAAGVIGSVLTLAVLPHTDYLKYYYQNTEVTNDSTGSVKPVTAKPTMASTSSIADTVEKISKAIVGVVNYQQQQNNDLWGNSAQSQSVQTGSGSGVIFQKNNDTAYIVTNNHVVEGASKLEISLFDGQKNNGRGGWNGCLNRFGSFED